MAATKNFTLYRGDDTAVYFDDGPVGSVAGWTTTLYLSLTPSSAPVLTVDGQIVDEGSPTTTGQFRVLVTKAESLALEARVYYYSFKRTDAGAEKVLTKGKAQIAADIKHAVA